MNRTAVIKKLENKILIQDNLEILGFIANEHQGGQSMIAFVSNRNRGNVVEVMKLYGVWAKKDLGDRMVFFLNSGSAYNEAVMKREMEILSQAGTDDYPSFPMPIDSGTFNGMVYMTMSSGKQARISESGEIGGIYDDYASGKIVTLEQILLGSTGSNGQQQKTIRAIRESRYTNKLAYYAEILRAVDTLHNKYRVAHNDIKPSQFLFLHTHISSKPTIQTLDLGMHIKLDEEQESRPYAESITTLMYNSPDKIRSYINSAKGRKYACNGEFSDRCIRNDIWSLGVILHEFIGTHPYIDTARLLMQQSGRISALENEYARYRDAQAYGELLVANAECVLEAQYRYLEEKERRGYTTRRLDWKFPARIERIAHGMTSDDRSMMPLSEVMQE